VGDNSSDIEAARAAGIMAHLYHGGDLADFVKQKIGARTASPDAN